MIEIEIIFRTISATALIVLIFQFGIVGRQAWQRHRRGKNGYTLAIFYWALASIVYSTNEILRLYLMGLESFPARGMVTVTGSAITRVLIVAAIVYLMRQFRYAAR